jgi:hypothetical protein
VPHKRGVQSLWEGNGLVVGVRLVPQGSEFIKSRTWVPGHLLTQRPYSRSRRVCLRDIAQALMLIVTSIRCGGRSRETTLRSTPHPGPTTPDFNINFSNHDETDLIAHAASRGRNSTLKLFRHEPKANKVIKDG